MNVPKEIYLNIFQHIRKSDLLEVSLVCKEWNLAALQRYYYTLTFHDRNTHRLISIIDQDQYFQYCHWVKMVEFSPKRSNICFGSSSSSEEEVEEEVEEKSLTKEQLLHFFSYIPNLKVLSVDATCNTNYLEYLLNLDESVHLKQLEKIMVNFNPFDFDSIYDLRYDVYFKFRKSLKKLVIFHERRPNMLIQYGGISNYLNQFENITHLKLISYSNPAATIYQLQVACPKLTALEFSTKNIQMLEHRTKDNAFLSTSNLKSLKLIFPRMSSSFADMLIYYLPTKLIKLYIKLDGIDLFDWIKLIGIERVLKLAERMSKILSAKLQCKLDEDQETHHAVHGESHMDLFFQILNAFKGNKKVLCTAEFSDKNSIYQMMSYSNGVLSINYGLKYQDMHGNTQDGALSDFELVQPEKTITNVGIEILNRIKFCFNTTNDRLLTYKILKYFLTNCPHLQYVEFEETNDRYPRFYLSSSSIIPDFYSNERLAPSTKTEENIQAIKLIHFSLSNDFINMLSIYLPNISYFKYVHDNEITPPAFIDLSDLKNLETFDLNVNCYLTDYDKICKLKINYIDGQDEIYKCEEVRHDIEIDSISSVAAPTLTLNFNKIMKLIQINTKRGGRFKIKYGVLQEAPCYLNYIDETDISYYFD